MTVETFFIQRYFGFRNDSPISVRPNSVLRQRLRQDTNTWQILDHLRSWKGASCVPSFNPLQKSSSDARISRQIDKDMWLVFDCVLRPDQNSPLRDALKKLNLEDKIISLQLNLECDRASQVSQVSEVKITDPNHRLILQIKPATSFSWLFFSTIANTEDEPEQNIWSYTNLSMEKGFIPILVLRKEVFAVLEVESASIFDEDQVPPQDLITLIGSDTHQPISLVLNGLRDEVYGFLDALICFEKVAPYFETSTSNSVDRIELRNLLNGFNENEFRNVCFELGDIFDKLSGETIDAKARELVLYCERRGPRTYNALVEIVRQKCPEHF